MARNQACGIGFVMNPFRVNKLSMFTWRGLNAFLHKLFELLKFFNNNNSNIFDKYVIIIDKNHIYHTHLKIFCKIKQFFGRISSSFRCM